MAQSDSLPDRFDAALFTTMQNVGPQLVQEMDLELTPGQVFMLHFISEQPDCTASVLSEKMQVNPSAVTVMLDRLEHHNFVERHRNSKDRRMIVLKLTETGRTALHQVLAIREHILSHCFNNLEPGKPELLVQLLEQVAEVSAALDMKAIISSFNNQRSNQQK